MAVCQVAGGHAGQFGEVQAGIAGLAEGLVPQAVQARHIGQVRQAVLRLRRFEKGRKGCAVVNQPGIAGR